MRIVFALSLFTLLLGCHVLKIPEDGRRVLEHKIESEQHARCLIIEIEKPEIELSTSALNTEYFRDISRFVWQLESTGIVKDIGYSNELSDLPNMRIKFPITNSKLSSDDSNWGNDILMGISLGFYPVSSEEKNGYLFSIEDQNQRWKDIDHRTNIKVLSSWLTLPLVILPHYAWATWPLHLYERKKMAITLVEYAAFQGIQCRSTES